ncbi:MAG: type II/IV secretion system protein, partial [Elusimicrobia bacterium]|nr:type II/IV secretion system protein [Elusimicrobiota bacterium]
AYSQYYGVPFFDAKHGVDSAQFHLLPEEVIRKYKVVPIKVHEKTLTVAMVDPDHKFAVEYIKMVSGYVLDIMGLLESDFNKILELYFESSNINTLVKDLAIPEVQSVVDEFVTGSEETPIVKLTDMILGHAVRLFASDIHLEPQDKMLLVRFRIDGILRTVELLPKNLHPNIVSRIKVIGGMDIAERRFAQDGQVRMSILERDIDLRVSTLPSRYGEKIVIRILDKTSFLLGLQQLGFGAVVQTKLEEIVTGTSGMFLVTGPTGSGKTTTLYACINRIRSSMINIITLEDPIEYELLAGKSREGGITQVQMNPKLGFTFVEGLKSTLRQDPDVIFVGEMRDKESGEIAFTAALTGHFVMSSLHTMDAPSTVTRLLDMGIEPFLIVSTLKGILAQRLVRVLCPYCKEAYKTPRRVLEKLLITNLPQEDSITLYRPKGCPWCGKSGFRGRRAVFELMEFNDTLRDLVQRKAPLSEISRAARENGMGTLRQSGLEAVLQGVSTISEVLRVTPSD